MAVRTLARALGLVAVASIALVSAKSDALPIQPPEGPVDPRDPDPIPPRRPPPLPTCAAPTLAQCHDPAYLDSYCGGRNATACGELIAPEYQAAVRALPGTDTVLFGAGFAKTLRTAKRFDAVAMPARKAVLGALTYQTASQIGRVVPPVSSSASLAAQHPTWEANGAQIASCQEYAFEETYDDGRFSEAAQSCNGNECVYQLARQTATPGLNQELNKKNGALMAWQGATSPRAFSRKKNMFFIYDTTFLRTLPRYTSDATFRAKAEAIIANVAGAPTYTASNEFAWHQQMHDRFATVSISQAERNDIDARLAAYSDAMEQHNVAVFALTLLGARDPNGMNPSDRANYLALVAQYTQMKTAADAIASTALLAEWDHVAVTNGTTLDRGCLSRSDIKCDWSPDVFASTYAHAGDWTRERAFSRCIDATGNDFATVPATAKASSEAFTAWLDAHDLPKVGSSTIGQRISDAETWGDKSWFAAGYSYDAGWALTGERQATSGRICKLKGNAYAKASASAWAFDNEIKVLDTETRISVREDANKLKWHSHFKILGEDLYTPVTGEWVTRSATPYDKQIDKTLATRTYTKWFSIAGVQVKLQAKTELKGGADIHLRADAADGCNPDNLAYDAAATARPWLKVHVVPELSVGIRIIQGGVRGDVDLVTASVPASASAKLVGGQTDLTLKIGMAANLTIDALKGNLSVFLESCLPFVGCTDLASKQVYQWDGYHWVIPLMNYNKDLSFRVFDAAVQPLPNRGPFFPPVVVATRL